MWRCGARNGVRGRQSCPFFTLPWLSPAKQANEAHPTKVWLDRLCFVDQPTKQISFYRSKASPSRSSQMLERCVLYPRPPSQSPPRSISNISNGHQHDSLDRWGRMVRPLAPCAHAHASREACGSPVSAAAASQKPIQPSTARLSLSNPVR